MMTYKHMPDQSHTCQAKLTERKGLPMEQGKLDLVGINANGEQWNIDSEANLHH